MSPVSARDVAAALVERVGPMSPAKLHALLYKCQGHHLAHFGVPLFLEEIHARDPDADDDDLWYAEPQPEGVAGGC
jgi:uncharacterized phage-associated protein